MAERSKQAFLWAASVLALPLIFTACMLVFGLLVPNYHWTAVNAIRTSETTVINPKFTVVQPFQVPWNHFSGIRVLLYDKGRTYPENSTLNVVLFDDTGSVITAVQIPAISIRNDQFYTVNFPEIPESRLQHYYLQFSTTNLTDGITVASSLQAQSPDLAYFVNGEVKNETLIFDMGFSRPGIKGQVLTRIILISLFLWILFLVRKPIRAFLNRIPFSVTISVLVLVFGSAFLVIEPPLHMYDEPLHFQRIWEVSTGKLAPSAVNNELAAYLPEYIQQTFNRISRLEKGTNQNPLQLHEMLLEKPGDPSILSSKPGLSTVYSYFAYLLPALFVKIGTPTVSVLGLTYLARLAYLLEYVLLTAWALNNARKGKFAIASVALLPFVLSLGTAINVDALLIGGSLLFLSSVVNIAYPTETDAPPTWSEVLGVIFGAFCILIAKHVYYPLFALVLLIPESRFGGKTQKLVTIAVFWAVTLLFALSLQAAMPKTSDPRIDMTGINYDLQLKYLLANPFHVIKVIINTLRVHFTDYYDQYVKLTGTAQKLGWFGAFQAALVLGFAWIESGDFYKKLKVWHYLLILAVILAVVVFVMLPLYLLWTPVAADTINGIQGRYFVPLIILILLLLKPPLNLRPKALVPTFAAAMSLLVVYFLWSTVLFFY